MNQDQKNQSQSQTSDKQDRSVIAVVAGYFTIEWVVKLIIGWIIRMELTKLWHKLKAWWKKRKEEKKNA